MNTKILIGLAVVAGLLFLVFAGGLIGDRDGAPSEEAVPASTADVPAEEETQAETEPVVDEPEDAAESELSEPIGELSAAGRFLLEQNGRTLLEEAYTIIFLPDTGHMLLSQSELAAGDVTIGLAQQSQFDRDYLPVFYQLAAETPSGSQIISAQLGLEGLTMAVRVGSSARDAVIPDARNVALLDNNLISHYAILLHAIEAGAIEPSFTAAIPQSLLSLPARYEGPSEVLLAAPGQELTGLRYDVFLGDTQIILVQAEGRLAVLANVSQGTYGYDIDLFPDGVSLPELDQGAAPPETIEEREVAFDGDGVMLEGTIALPKTDGPHPAVLFLHGSGPVDRDGNAPGMQMDAYRQLAHALAENGIVSLRYDKRGIGASTGDAATASMSDLAADGAAALEFLSGQDGVDAGALFLVGHSEGAYLIPLIAQTSDAAGAALLAGAARPLDEITWWQIETLLRQSGAEIAQIEAARVQQNEYFAFVENSIGEWSDYTNEDLQAEMTWLSDVAAEQLRATPLGLGWLREHYTADTRGALAALTVPVLTINGEKDLQVPASEGARIAEILRDADNDDVAVHVLENLNHLLRYHPEEPNLVVRHIDQPVDDRVIDLLVQWILEIADR